MGAAGATAGEEEALMQEWLKELVEVLPGGGRTYRRHGSAWLELSHPRWVVPVRRVLRDHTGYQRKVLTDRTAVDLLGQEDGPRFKVWYSLLSVRYGRRLNVTVYVQEAEARPSVTSVFLGAGWRERETWERFGIPFEGNPDRRRLLTDYGFQGYPLRKDFPVTGRTEVRYDEREKRVVQEPLTLAQGRRRFDFEGEWPAGQPYRVEEDEN